MASIKEIRAREQAATGGKWRWDVNLKGKCVELEASGGLGAIVLSCVRWGMGQAGICFNVDGFMVRCDDERLAKVIPGREHHASWARVIEHPDADFIAHARQDIPDLLDALEEHGTHTAECLIDRPKSEGWECSCGWAEIEQGFK